MENTHSEFEKLVIENCKLKANLKAANYEKEKLLELVKNLLSDLDTPVTPSFKPCSRQPYSNDQKKETANLHQNFYETR